MSCRQVSPAMRAFSTLAVYFAVVLPFLVAQVNAQGSNATVPWKTLKGDPPLVIARGGFSGLLPDSSFDAYRFALLTGVSDIVLFCDVQLTKDGVGICFYDIKLDNASNVAVAYKNRQSTYSVNGVPTKAWFTLDFTAKEFGNISLIQPIYSRSNKFDNNYQIVLVEDVAQQLKPPGYWINIQYDSFYAQHNLSMRSYVLSLTRSTVVNYISSPEVNFLQSIAGRLRRSATKFVFRFLQQDATEPTTNQTYGSLLKNLTFIKTFASGILVPKTYIWPVDPSMYLLPHTSLVQDAHKAGLEVYAADFANDFSIAYNYSYDPISEYLSFVDNGDFSVDGVLSDFPITPSEAFDCFSHLSSKAPKQVDVLVISKNGASGDYPGCTDLAYEKAIKDGADIIDCPVQMSSDGIPFCLSSIDLTNSTTVAQSGFNNLSLSVPEINGAKGIYSFSLSWSQIQTLRPAIENPFTIYRLFRNPKNKNAGKIISLSEFLSLAKNSTSLSGVMINVENAAYLAEKQGLDIVGAVLGALKEGGYNNLTSKKVMIQSTNSSVLTEFKEKSNYEFVYKIEEEIRDILGSAVEDIKKIASSVVLGKRSVFPVNEQFATGSTDVVSKLKKSNISVFVEIFSNEFISQAWDFFSDPTVEVNSFVQGAGINGVITDFPKTSARYRKNVCLGDKELPPYMSPVQPGGLLEIVDRQALPPAEAPKPVFTDSDVIEPPLPPVTAKPPASTPGQVDTPLPKPNGQARVASSILTSSLVMLLATLSIL